MARPKLRNHTYIDDGIIYTNYVFEGSGKEIRASRIWERWNHTGKIGEGRMDKILSYDNGYTVGNITNVLVIGSKKMMIVAADSGRRLHVALDSRVLTDQGMTRVRDLGIGTPLLTLDNYKGYRGDTLRLLTHGNARVRAMLRNHGVPFEVGPNDGTATEHWNIYCLDFDTDGPVVEGNSITYGLNNYRDGLKQLFGLTDASTADKVASIKEAKQDYYGIAIYVDGPQNIVMHNGFVIESTQTPVQDDW